MEIELTDTNCRVTNVRQSHQKYNHFTGAVRDSGRGAETGELVREMTKIHEERDNQ